MTHPPMPLPRKERFNERGKCAKSGKRPYRDKVSALLDNADAPIIARAYQCLWCLKWHLTRGSPFACDYCGDGDALRVDESCAYCGEAK